MHSRHHRNPENGYRFGPMGGSNMAAGSHASPEGLSRGPGFYKSENRNFNRSFSRNQGQTHQGNFHHPLAAPSTSARDDVFMEVGRLAAEYLVSQGVLPPSVLPAKWQNGSLKKPASEFQEFRPHDEEHLQYAGEARTSALARLGNTGFDGESGRRKYNDDYGTAGPKNYMRGKRKGGSSRNYGSDWGREYGRSGFWSDRNRDRNSPSMGIDQDSSYRHREEHPFGKDSGDRRTADYDSGSRFHEAEQLGKDDERNEIDHDSRSKCNEEQLFGKGDSDMSDLTGTSVMPPKGMESMDSESDIKGHKLLEELPEMKDSDVVNDIQEMAGGEINSESIDLGDSQQISEYDVRISREEPEDDSRSIREIKESKGETLEEIISQDQIPDHLAEPTSLSENNGDDLKAVCKFANVPTRIRSSLANGAKGRTAISHEGTGLTGLTEVRIVDRNLGVSINDGSSGGYDKPNLPDLKMPKVKSPRFIEEERSLHSGDATVLAREAGSGNSLGYGKSDSAPLLDQATSASPRPLEDGMLENVQSLNQECQGSISVDSVVDKREEKRPHGGIDSDGRNVRRKESPFQSTRDWLAPASINAGSCITSPVSGEVNKIGDSLPDGENATTVGQGGTVDNFQLPEVLHKPGFMDNTEEKQFFPSSFKICDLNLMESSIAHENNDRDPIFLYPSVSAVKKNDSPIDIDLSIYNPVKSAENSTNMADGRGMEIIDLDSDSAPEQKTLSETEIRREAEFMGLEGFSTSAPNAADIPDSQDGYGLMISELLANDFPGISSVPGDINPLDNTGIQGPLPDDDSIYMTLGEIPFLSFMRNWENPAPQEDGKPF